MEDVILKILKSINHNIAPISVTNSDNNIVYCNNYFSNLFGIKNPEDLLNKEKPNANSRKQVDVDINPDDFGLIEKDFDDIKFFEVTINYKGGKLRCFLEKEMSIGNQKISIFNETSMLNETIDNLIISNSKYRNLLTATQTAFIITDENLMIAEGNEFAKQILDNIDFIGLNLIQMINNDNNKHKFMLLVKQLLENPLSSQPVSIELYVYNKKWIDVTFNCLKNGINGNENKFFFILKDITTQKSSENLQYIHKEKNKDLIKQKIKKIKNTRYNNG